MITDRSEHLVSVDAIAGTLRGIDHPDGDIDAVVASHDAVQRLGAIANIHLDAIKSPEDPLNNDALSDAESGYEYHPK